MQVAARTDNTSGAGDRKGAVTSAACAADFARLLAVIAESQDRAAFQQLFMHFAPRIKAFLMGQGADADFAEDVMQDAMVAVWTKAGLYAPSRGSAAAWIFTIARNLRIDRMRRQSSKPYVDIDDIELDSGEGASDDAVTRRQRGVHVTAAVARLPDKQRQVILMSFVEDLPQSEIADRLGLPLGTVKSRMRLAYARLLQELERIR